ncbi:tRNA threonylcarbamoyladenosine biosynthesis protein TsaE [Entomoplasma freundtii]|uniref:tRNA threonylcarbamoyladenosine biosynthesis protein TsaE n=1 Tax=Entomoplasma freundtii TaxID=74700 RepID=A0A2K8NU95_9MOLU|nr:tRNA (adenosine(37)-N6)-threonylcarbamoyltransferase complex ATPase subunit type 1 TsaE [Entomoplasma freundtii]ATZ16193.1 tRNA (N6-adenosine(37)-N6)-threonylcarbamoyltransferase complex ATPase TsaE [Entomoplasma freundtii]TDY56906.1 tRNA threonylcarbamoyladenosine biosynthesis protein TsaE [Entomoplasma freundtii]
MNFSKETTYFLEDLRATQVFAQELATFLSKQKRPFYLLLTGDLGAGKTTLTKALMKALNVLDPITSPTFVILNQYESSDNQVINHMDAYRLTFGEDSSMYEEYFADNLNIIEWPENLALNWEALSHLKLEIKIVDENRRQVTIK